MDMEAPTSSNAVTSNARDDLAVVQTNDYNFHVPDENNCPLRAMTWMQEPQATTWDPPIITGDASMDWLSAPNCTETLLQVVATSAAKGQKNWARIAQEMTDQGFLVTPDVCRNKFHKLRSEFLRWKDNQPSSEGNRVDFPYKEQFARLYDESDAVEHVALYTASGKVGRTPTGQEINVQLPSAEIPRRKKQRLDMENAFPEEESRHDTIARKMDEAFASITEAITTAANVIAGAIKDRDN